MKRLPITARTTSEMEATDSKTTIPSASWWKMDFRHRSFSDVDVV